MIDLSEDGVEKYFQEGSCNDADVAKNMVDTTQFVCCLRRGDDGNIVGDCKNCYKQLGYHCVGASYLRNKFGLLDLSLETRRKSPRNAHNGVRSLAAAKGTGKHVYKSGLTKSGSKPRGTPLMSTCPNDYLKEQFH
jgi:hypothetical protein